MSIQMNRRKFLEKGSVVAATLSAGAVGMVTAACAPSVDVGVPPGEEGSAPSRDQVLAIARKYGMIFREA